MKSKFISIFVVLVVTVGLFLGFKISDNIFGSKTNGPAPDVANYHSQSFQTDNVPVYTDDFDAANDSSALKLRGYKPIQNSNPLGILGWLQGSTATFLPYNGPTTGYVAANYNSTTGSTGIIDDWLIFPRIAGGIQAGDSLTFWCRSSTLGTNYPDSVRVYYSANGDSVVAGTWAELGRFKVVNPAAGAPNNGWERKAYRAPTAGANGRFAIVYHVNGAGPSGANSDYVGFDAARIERTAVTPPAPTTWYDITTPVATTLYSVSAPDINNVWAAGAAGKVIRATNGGTFTAASGNLPATDIIYSMWAMDANNAVVTTSPGATFVWKTTNGGTNWVQTFTQASPGFIDGFYFKDANNGIMMGDAVGGRVSLWRTTNGGSNWDSTGMRILTADAGWNNAMCGVGDNVWFGTNATKVYYSSNFGSTWAAGGATGEANSDAVWFNSATNGMMGGNTLVQLSTNAGTSWTTVTAPGTGITFGITGTDVANYWICRGAIVGATTNSGAAWTTAYTTTAGTFQHIVKSRTGSAYLYACTTTGHIAKYGGTTVGTGTGSTVVDNYSLGQNYPNPFNPTTNIEFAIPQNGFVTLKVYNMVGKEVATLVNGSMGAGAHTINFNASNLASGVYFYKLETANFSEVKKMSLIK